MRCRVNMWQADPPERCCGGQLIATHSHAPRRRHAHHCKPQRITLQKHITTLESCITKSHNRITNHSTYHITFCHITNHTTLQSHIIVHIALPHYKPPCHIANHITILLIYISTLNDTLQNFIIPHYSPVSYIFVNLFLKHLYCLDLPQTI